MSYYRMHRGWMDHPTLRGPLCRAAAWAWLIEQACWKPSRISIAGKTVELARGQLSYSLRYLADAWGWERDAVRRYLTRLETDTMIATATATGQMVITICNYDKYQADAPDNATPNATATATAARQDRDSSATNKNKGKEVKEESVGQHTLFSEESIKLNGHSAELPKKKGRSGSGLSPWPDGFSLTEDMAAFSRARLPDNPKKVFEEFQSKAEAKGWQYANWSAAWRTFILQEVKFRGIGR